MKKICDQNEYPADLQKGYQSAGNCNKHLSINLGIVILRLDRGIQNILKILDSRLRENDEFTSDRNLWTDFDSM
jgi:hypothetical protein